MLAGWCRRLKRVGKHHAITRDTFGGLVSVWFRLEISSSKYLSASLSSFSNYDKTYYNFVTYVWSENVLL